MKKNYFSIIMTLVLVLSVSFGAYYLINNWDNLFKTYSDSYCITDRVTEGMTPNKIAKLYNEACVSVVVKSTPPTRAYTNQSLGSGVCIAAKGYQTEGGYQANKGSYFVTNYHVVEQAVSPLYSNYTSQIKIQLFNEDSYHDARVLWSNSFLDVAILYCDDDLDIGWITMKDRVYACAEEDKLCYDDVFVLGNPLDIDYKGTLSIGYVSNNNFKLAEGMVDELYMYSEGGSTKYVTDPNIYLSTSNFDKVEVLGNIYEDIVMMNCDITNGNSGGGVFDENGYLVGLATLGLNYTASNTMAINFFVPIYSAQLVLDKLILSNEGQGNQTIYEMSSLGFVGFDANEANVAAYKYVDNKITDRLISYNGTLSYYYNGKFYKALDYSDDFKFDGDGVYILENYGANAGFREGYSITAVDKNDPSARVQINTRNDLIYFLLGCNSGETVNVTITSKLGFSQGVTIRL